MNKKALKEELTKLKTANDEIIANCERETRTLANNEDAEFNKNLARMQEIRSLLDEEVGENIGKVKGVKDMENKDIKKEFYEGLANGEVRMLNQTGGEGNVAFENTVPETLVNDVVKYLQEKGQVAKDCKMMNVAGNVKLFAEKEGVQYAQVLGENEVIAETNMSDLNVITLGTKRVGDLIVVSKQLLMNSPIVAEQMIVEQLSKRVDNTLARDVMKGSGVDKNLVGVLTLKDDKEVGKVETGDILDDLLDLTLDIHPTLLNGCKFYMTRNRFKAIAKLKDAQGQYYVVRDVVNGKPSYKIFGYEIVITDEANDTEIVFANLKEAMVINVQKAMEIQVLKENYARANAVGILVNMMLDNAIRNKQAIRILKQA